MENTAKPSDRLFTLDTKYLERNKMNDYSKDKVSFELFHRPDDHKNVNRLKIKVGELEAELYPSKGLSLGQAICKGQKLFWDAPCELPDPENLDLWSDEVLINGQAQRGFEFLKTFSGGIEFYGLKNWGMPRIDEGSGGILPLHGETSNIPVEQVNIKVGDDYIILTSELIYHDMLSLEHQPWYKRGIPLFRIHKYFRFEINPAPVIKVKDIIENISDRTLVPDWGYHITFNPESGAKLLVPSGQVFMRGDGSLPEDIETWYPSTREAIREETGIIHKGLEKEIIGNEELCKVLLQYQHNNGLLCLFSPSPYFQTWFCRGGAGSDEFKSKSGESLIKKDWDGVGIEIGSSALDHDGNIDSSVFYNPSTDPGQSKIIKIEIRVINPEEENKLADQIRFFNRNRK